MAHDRVTHEQAGWGRSDKQTYTIVNADTGAGNSPVNLGRNYAYVVIRCADCSHIAGSTTLGIKTAMDEAQALCSSYIYESNTLTLVAPTLPTSGSMQFYFLPALGAQYVHLTLSKNTSGGTAVFEIYGLAESIEG